MDNDNWTEFLRWEITSRDTIDFKTIYVDMADDLVAGLLLSQIVYWYLPSKKGQSKLRVFKDGYYWIAKARHEWWDEIRVKTRQIDRAITILEEKGIIVSYLYRFNNAPTTHVRIIKEGFLAAWNNVLARFDETVKSEVDPFSPNRQFDFTDSASGFDETVISDLPESVQSLTETTIDSSEITAENTLLPIGEESTDIIDQIIEQTKMHPDQFDLGRQSEIARDQAGGNYAVPAHANGDDRLAAFGLFCLYDKRGKRPPRQDTKTYRQQREKVAEALRAYDYQQAQPELIEKAAELLCERKAEWVNPYYKSFIADFGTALSDAEYFIKHGRLPANDKKGKPHATRQHIAPHAAPHRVHTPESAAPFIAAIYGDD